MNNWKRERFRSSHVLCVLTCFFLLFLRKQVSRLFIYLYVRFVWNGKRADRKIFFYSFRVEAKWELREYESKIRKTYMQSRFRDVTFGLCVRIFSDKVEKRTATKQRGENYDFSPDFSGDLKVSCCQILKMPQNLNLFSSHRTNYNYWDWWRPRERKIELTQIELCTSKNGFQKLLNRLQKALSQNITYSFERQVFQKEIVQRILITIIKCTKL